MTRSLIHPQLMRHLAPTHFPNTVTVQQAVRSYDASNEPIETWVDDPLLRALPAAIEPLNAKQEVRRRDQTIVENGWNIIIAGYFERMHEAQQVVDEQQRAHNILSVTFDAFKTQTILITEIINLDPST